MSNLSKIMEEPLTQAELERNLQIINTLLPNSEGELKRLRLAEKEQLELRIAVFENPKPDNIIVIDDTISTVDNTAKLRPVKAPRTANEILVERAEHKFTSSLYREAVVVNNPIHPMQNVLLGLAGCY